MESIKSTANNQINPSFDNIKASQIKDDLAALINNFDNSFPIEVFPHRIVSLIKATNSVFNFPKEYVASSILFVNSLAMGNTFKIIPKNGWEENGALWITLVGNAGAVKSPIFKYVLKPIRNLNEEAFRQYEIERDEYEFLTKEEQHAKSCPVETSYFIQDASPEKLMQLHADNPRGIGSIQDEIVSLLESLERNQSGAEGQLLTAWDGSGHKVDRIGRKSFYIKEMFIPIIGGTQPSKLHNFSKNGRDSSGFMARFLFCHTEVSKKGRWNKKQLSDSHEIYWDSVVRKIISNKAPHVMQLTDEAYGILEKWQHFNANEVDDLGEGTLAEIFNKAERQCLRLALNLQVFYWACDEGDLDGISVRAVKGAIALIEYFKDQAQKVCHHLYDASPLERLPKNKKEFYNDLPDEFVAKDALFICAKHDISRSTFYRMARPSQGLFQKQAQGNYIKTA